MATSPTVVVFDYGFGNVRSAVNSLIRAGAAATVTADATAALECDGLVVPGVGAFAACMTGLTTANGPAIIEDRISRERPVLGICVGMQVLFSRGVEHGHDAVGLGVFTGVVERLHAPVLPHMGWNTVEAGADSGLFTGIGDERFYFVHSYGVRKFADPATITSWTTHGEPFVAAVERGPVSATQFHPEKSGDAGVALLRNWLSSL